MFTKWLAALDIVMEELPPKTAQYSSGTIFLIVVGLIVGVLLITGAVFIGVAIYRSKKDK